MATRASSKISSSRNRPPLLGALLRLGIGAPPPTYSPDAIDRHVFPLGRLIDAVRVARG